MRTLIKRLVECAGPSGFESEIRQLIREEVDAYADEIQVDTLGNLIVRKGKKSQQGSRIMVAAHMDEIGIMGSHIDKNGFVRFTNIGGLFWVYLLGSRVQFLNGIKGVIESEKRESRTTVPSMEKMYIDVGATSRENCPIKVGDVGVFDRSYIDLGDRLVSKAMDDRIGVAILIDTLKKLKKTLNEIYFVFSSQEEVGTRGATTSAYSLDPDIGLSVDVTMTGDTPKGITMEVSLGKGPAIKVRDSGMISDPRLVDAMIKIATEHKIPYQLEVLDGGTTDARAIQLSRAGIPSSCISIPSRYVHSPSEMVDINDVQNAVKLLHACVSNQINLKPHE